MRGGLINITEECNAVIRQVTALTVATPNPGRFRASILCVAFAAAIRDAGIDDADAVEMLEEVLFETGQVDLASEPGAH